MKLIILTIITVFASISYAEDELGKRLNLARETLLAKVEYSEISSKGIIRVKDCRKCDFDIYNINESTIVTKNNSPVSVEMLVGEYWDVKIATLLVSFDSQNLEAIHYYK